jgi:hypothetical protein
MTNMIVTGAFLAEAASVADGKLYVLGGVVVRWTRMPGSVAVITIVVLTQADEDHPDNLEVTIHGPNGQSMVAGIPIPDITHEGNDAGFFLGQIGIGPEAPDGRYVIVLGDISMPLTLNTA